MFYRLLAYHHHHHHHHHHQEEVRPFEFSFHPSNVNPQKFLYEIQTAGVQL
jgi:hypothetical protein